MGMMSEFKEFALKGNVMDLAVGVIIGGAFGKIVDSLINDIIMPIVGKILGNVDFSNSSVYRATDRWTAANPNGSMPRTDAICLCQFITLLPPLPDNNQGQDA